LDIRVGTVCPINGAPSIRPPWGMGPSDAQGPGEICMNSRSTATEGSRMVPSTSNSITGAGRENENWIVRNPGLSRAENEYAR